MKTLKLYIQKDKELLRELFLAIDESVRKKRKTLSHMRFARPTKKGWSFFTKKSIAWDMLEDICHKAGKQHPHCHRAEIAEILSRLINVSDKQMAYLRSAVL